MKQIDDANVIAMSLDRKYVDFATVAIDSWLRHSKRPTSFVIMANDGHPKEIEDEMKEMLDVPDGCSLSVVNISDLVGSRFDEWHVSRHISVPTYFKVFIPQILPKCRKVLYLDSDICIVDAMDDIFDVEMENDEIVGGVEDFEVWKFFVKKIANMNWIPDDIRKRLDKEYGTIHEWYKREMLLDPVHNPKYMNGGVALFDIQRCLDFNLTEKCIELIEAQTKKNGWIFFHDQDTLNSVCRDGCIKWMPKKWNVLWKISAPYTMNVILKRKKLVDEGHAYVEETKHPCLVHYAGDKPWDAPSKHYAMSLHWWSACRKLPFFEKHLSRLSPGVQKSLLSRLDEFEGQSKPTLDQFM
jgi:lipopolysaccharide biosynthesis glycosyltransferase